MSSVAARSAVACLCLVHLACSPVRPAVPGGEWGPSAAVPSPPTHSEPEQPSAGGPPLASTRAYQAQAREDATTALSDTTAALSARLRAATDFPHQIVSVYLRHLTGGSDAIQRGDLVLELCRDRRCGDVAARSVVRQGTLLGAESAQEVSAEGLPAGTWFARFGLDTKLSRDGAGTYGLDGGFGPFDVLQQADATARPAPGENPAAGTVEVTLRGGARVDLGEIVLGSIVFEELARPPAPEEGWLLAASSGDDSHRNLLRRVALSSFEVDRVYELFVRGEESAFRGDICGLLPAHDGLVYVIASRPDGAYVSAFDTTSMSFLPSEAVHIPHPSAKSGARLEPEMVPWPCRGAVVDMDGRRFLYLVSFKESGSRMSSSPYPLVAVEVTGMSGPGESGLVAAYDAGVMPFFDSSRVLRGAASDGTSLFLLEPSWSKLTSRTLVWALALFPDGTVSEPYLSFEAGHAEDTCGSGTHRPPAMAVVPWGGSEHLVVGSDEGLQVFDTRGDHVSSLDLGSYGSMFASLALSPDRSRLYALPACRSGASTASLKLGMGPARATLARHAVAVVDLDSDPSDPALLLEDRDLDKDGEADGGIDLEYLQLKGRILRWCPDCSGALPPTTYTGPEIVAGTRSLFVRGSDTRSDGQNASGLGQSGDLGVLDIESGHGAVIRSTKPWLDGPDARWGYDLDTASPGRAPSDDVAVSALVFVPGW